MGFSRGCIRADGASRGGHRISFCNLKGNKESDDGFESIYQDKIVISLNSDSKDMEGVCYFLKTRLPTAQGMVNRTKWLYYEIPVAQVLVSDEI